MKDGRPWPDDVATAPRRAARERAFLRSIMESAWATTPIANPFRPATWAQVDHRGKMLRKGALLRGSPDAARYYGAGR